MDNLVKVSRNMNAGRRVLRDLERLFPSTNRNHKQWLMKQEQDVAILVAHFERGCGKTWHDMMQRKTSNFFACERKSFNPVAHVDRVHKGYCNWQGDRQLGMSCEKYIEKHCAPIKLTLVPWDDWDGH